MDFDLTEEQRLLQLSVQRYLDDCYTSDLRRQIATSATGISEKVWGDFARFGWLALPVPEVHGGLGGGVVDVALLMECFGRALVLEPYVSTVVIGAGLIAALGTATQCDRWLAPVTEGRMRLALAHAEPNTRHRMHRVATRAQPRGDGWHLQGRKKLVLDGPGSDTLLVSARLAGQEDDAAGIALFVVPKATAGLREHAFTTIDGRRACHLELDVIVDAQARVGGDEDTLHALDHCLDLARIALAAESMGCMDALLEATIAYTKTRQQFDRPLAANQVLRHRMVDMAVACEEARAILLHALIMAGAPAHQRARATSAALNKVARAGRFVAEQAVQLHGAMGVTDEVLIGAWLKRLVVCESLYGVPAFHLQRHAALSGLVSPPPCYETIA